MNDYLGAHMSISGGLHLAIDRAVAAGDEVDVHYYGNHIELE